MWLLFFIYFANVSENLSNVTMVIAVIGLFITIITSIVISSHDYGIVRNHSTSDVQFEAQQLFRKNWFNRSKWLLPLFIILMFISVLLPSQKTVYTMLAAYVGIEVVKSDKVQKISNSVLALIESKLKEAKEKETVEPEPTPKPVE